MNPQTPRPAPTNTPFAKLLALDWESISCLSGPDGEDWFIAQDIYRALRMTPRSGGDLLHGVGGRYDAEVTQLQMLTEQAGVRPVYCVSQVMVCVIVLRSASDSAREAALKAIISVIKQGYRP